VEVNQGVSFPVLFSATEEKKLGVVSERCESYEVPRLGLVPFIFYSQRVSFRTPERNTPASTAERLRKHRYNKSFEIRIPDSKRILTGSESV
jgi:hypothetical protein